MHGLSYVKNLGLGRVMVGLVFLFFLTSCFAGPKDVVASKTESLIAELKQNRSKAKNNNSYAQQVVLKHVNDAFDFVGMTRFSFGRPWRDASDAQKKRAVAALKQIWLNQYTSNMTEYLDAKIVTTSRAKPPYGKKVVVRSAVTYQGQKNNIDYRMWETSQGWKIYDVMVDGVSLLINYRNQLREHLRTHSFEETVQMLEGKAK